jgi:rRNA maturation endonuclease Nob1
MPQIRVERIQAYAPRRLSESASRLVPAANAAENSDSPQPNEDIQYTLSGRVIFPALSHYVILMNRLTVCALTQDSLMIRGIPMGFLDKLKEGATKAADKAKETVEVTRLNTQISGKKRDIERSYAKIGETVFQAYADGDLSAAEPEIQTLSQDIIGWQKEIAALEQKIKEVKNEKDCVCGKVVPLDAKFCQGCGHKFEEPVQPVGAAVTVVQANCPSCASVIEEDARFCGNCGHTLA